MAQTQEELETPLTSGTTDNPDAPQSSVVAPPPLPQGYSRAGQGASTAQEAPPLPTGYKRPGQVEDKNFIDKMSDNPIATPDQKIVAGAAKAARGLYHGVMGDEESEVSRGKTSTASPVAENLGFTPEHMAHQAGTMAHDVGKFVYGVGKDLNSPMPVVSENEWGSDAKQKGYKGPTFLEKYVTAPAEQEKQEALEEAQKFHQTQGWEAFGHALNNYIHTAGEFVPMAGPFAAQLIKKAQSGDVGGALAQVAALKAGERAQHAVTGELKTRANAALEGAKETPQVTQAKANVDALGKELAKKQAAFDAAKAAHDQYAASHAQGVAAPKNVTNAMSKAGAELEEAQFHHDSAAEALKKTQAAQPSLPQQAGSAVGNIIAKVLPKKAAPAEVPAAEIEAAPAPAPLKKLGVPAPPINVKTPGQIQPETIQQTPTAIPRSPLGRIDLANGQGTVGKQPLLGEGTPEGPQVPAAGLPKLKQEVLPPAKPAIVKPERGNVKALTVDEKGNVLDKEQTPEGRLQKLLEESLKDNEAKKKTVAVPETKAAPEAKAEKTPEEKPVAEKRNEDRRQEDVPVEDERRSGERRVLNEINNRTFQESVFGGAKKEGIDTDAYAKAMGQARKELGPDASVDAVIKRRNELVNPEAKGGKGDIGEQSRQANPEPTRAETKGTAKKEAKSKTAEEHQPAVQEQVNALSDENLKKLAKAHDLNPDDYDFKARDEGRHRTERNLLAQHIVESMGDDEKTNLGRAADKVAEEGQFENAAKTSKSKAERAATLFPRLRGAVDEFGNPEVSGGSQTADVAKHASDYNKEEGRPELKPEKVEKSPRAKEIATEYENMKHDPKDPEVKKSYDALVDDTKKQWDYATKKMGIKIEPTDEDPYKSYEEMRDDVKNNKRLKVFKGGNPLPEDHPLAAVDPKTGENYNTMFRAVHDLFGHTAQDHDFSEKGEENAWNVHRQMMTPEAVPAMTTETRGQTSWFFNHGEEPGAYAEQKAGILPDFANESTPDAQAALGHIKSGKDFAVLTAENPNNTRASAEVNAKRNRELVTDLRKKGYEPISVEGHTKDVEGEKEHSYLVKDIKPEEAAELGKKHDQAAVLTTEGLHDLKKDTVNPSDNKNLLTGEEARKQPYYTRVGDQDFSVPIDFDKEVKPRVNSKGSPIDEFGNPTVSGGSPAAGEAKAKTKTTPEELQKTLPEEAQKHLTPEEKASLTTTATGKPRTAGTQKFISNMEKIPSIQAYTDIALQGEGARKWYSRSTAAFNAMHEEAPDYFKEGDKEKFMGVLAGSSPQQSVAMNLRETLGFWKEWNDAGRPTFSQDNWKKFGEAADKAWEDDGSPRARGLAKGASMHWDYAPKGPEWKAENLLLKNLTLPETKVPNIIKALNGEQMWPDLTKNQAFKAPSFAENLRKWINGKSTGTKNVTNDSWMGLFGGIDKSALSKPENYHPLSVSTRAAAEALGWEPEEAQAAIWSFTQALTEKGVEDPEIIRHYSEDFKDLLANDLEARDQLKGLGVNLDQLDKKLEAIGEKPKVSGRSTPTTSHSVGQLRGRIEDARGKGAIPEPKSVQGNLFRENPAFEHKANPGAGHITQPRDEATRFNPEDFETEASTLEKLGKKKSPLGRIK